MSEYDADFFGWQADGSQASAEVVAPLIDQLIQPTSVLDVGCGLGTWASQWPGAIGVDGGDVPRDSLRIDPMHFVPHDLTTPLHLERRFDMALCLEVAEHLPRRAAKTLVKSLVDHSDVIVFSAAVPEQGGIGHLNEQWPSYWAKLFAAHGYRPYDLLRDELWWDQRVEWWYRQNLLVFATDEAASARSWTPPTRSIDLAQPALLMPELGCRTGAKRLKATVCIPWRPSPSRMAAYERVRAFWEMFGWPVVTADSDTEVFSLAQARNNAVRKAKTEVVVVADADTLIDPLCVIRAVADPAGVWWPFSKYRILDMKYLDVPLAELSTVPHINTWDGDGIAGVGGCMVSTKREWWRLGGQPPEFIGWGWEDVAFTTVVRTLSQARRMWGTVYAFEHNVTPPQATGSVHDTYVGATADSPGWDRDVDRNKDLFAPYLRADQCAWKMRALVNRGVSV